MERNQFPEKDDGRTIADMSDLSSPSLLFPKIPKKKEPILQEQKPAANDRPWEDHSLSREEQKWYVLGALKAALLIGACYVVGIGVFGWLFLKLCGLSLP